MSAHRNFILLFCCSFIIFIPLSRAQVIPQAKTTAPPTNITAPAPEKPTKLKTPPQPTPTPQNFDDVFQALDYPELQVIPSASERLRLQASEESKHGWYSYWPVQVASLTLITSAIMSSSYYDTDISANNREAAQRAKNISLAIGSSWLIGTGILSFSRPYRTGFKKISDVSNSTRADRLRRERLAEEHLQYPGEIAKKLKYIAIGSNFLASVAMLPNQDNSGQIIIGVSALAAFLPLIFDTTYESTWDKHQEYKRRIYVPLVGLNTEYASMGLDSRGVRMDKLTMTWSF